MAANHICSAFVGTKLRLNILEEAKLRPWPSYTHRAFVHVPASRESFVPLPQRERRSLRSSARCFAQKDRIEDPLIPEVAPPSTKFSPAWLEKKQRSAGTSRRQTNQGPALRRKIGIEAYDEYISHHMETYMRGTRKLQWWRQEFCSKSGGLKSVAAGKNKSKYMASVVEVNDCTHKPPASGAPVYKATASSARGVE
ncbi:hypothetical protein CYMTET_33629, partial [Cymbomonas tetramitiformis]